MSALDDFLDQLTEQYPVAAPPQFKQPKRLDKIVIGWLYQPICGVGVLQHGTFESLWDFVRRDRVERNVLVDFVGAVTPYVPSGRNDLCRMFLKQQADWFLIIDWDITFRPDDVYKLLDAADPIERPIIAGCYVTFMTNDGKLRPCWMIERDGLEFSVTDRCDVSIDELTQCSAVGMGFTLIHRDVIEAVAAANKHDPWLWFGQDNIAGAHIGEDMTFCSRARRLGYTVWGHGGVQLGHTKSKMWTLSDIECTAVNVDEE